MAVRAIVRQLPRSVEQRSWTTSEASTRAETLESSRRSTIRRNRSRCRSSKVCHAVLFPSAAAVSSDLRILFIRARTRSHEPTHFSVSCNSGHNRHTIFAETGAEDQPSRTTCQTTRSEIFEMVDATFVTFSYDL